MAGRVAPGHSNFRRGFVQERGEGALELAKQGSVL
jgi:hypothetical protein